MAKVKKKRTLQPIASYKKGKAARNEKKPFSMGMGQYKFSTSKFHD